MSDPAQQSESGVSRVRIGVATHVTPGFSLVGEEPLQDLLLCIDECVDAGEITEDMLEAEMRQNHVRHDAPEMIAKAPPVDQVLSEVRTH